MIRQNAVAFDTQQIAFRVALTFFSLCWTVVMLVRLRLPDSNQESTQGLVVFVVGAACWTAASQSTLLARSWSVMARVLRARQVPATLWRQSLHDSLKSASRIWAALAFGVVSVLLPAHSPFSWLTALALMALVLMLALLARLAAAGLIPRFWFWVFPLTFVLGLSSVFTEGGFWSLVNFLNALSWVLQLAVCLSAPALLVWLQQRWCSGPPQAMEVPLGMNLPLLFKKLKDWFAQYVPLTQRLGQTAAAARGPQNYVVNMVLLPLLVVTQSTGGFAQPLGSPLTVSHVLMFGFMVLMVNANMVCKGLHWRLLLAPGGPHRARLGWNIAISTATLYTLGFLAILGLGVAGVSAVSGEPLRVIAGLAAQIAPLPFELVFAIALNTLIRGTRHPLRWFVLLVLVWLVVLIALFTSRGAYSGSYLSLAPLVVDFPYLLSLLALSFLALWASNKLWTVERLLQCTPRGA
jgi:hypothetical protein